MGIDYTKRPATPPTPPPPPQQQPPQQGGYPPPGYPPQGPPPGYPQQGGYPPPPPPGYPQQGGYPPPPPPGYPQQGGYPPPQQQGHPQQGQQGGVSLSKVTLTKSAPTVSLSKHGGQGGMLRVNLNWNARPEQKGLFRKNTQLDLDLGCLYEFADGSKGVVQALGNAFQGDMQTTREVLISLDGDDRSGRVSTGENMTVNLQDISKIRRILVFALIYEGAANWAAAQGLLTIFPVNAPPIEIHLDDPRDGARICAVAQLVNNNGELVIQREVNYLNGAQRVLDQAYGWGMNWTAGRK